MLYALGVVNVKLSNDLFIGIWDFIFKFKKIHMSKTTSFTFSKNSNKRFFLFNCQRQHHSFFKNFKPNLLLFAYDKRSTLYFSNFSNKIIYLLYKSKKASITFENIQIKHAHVKDDNQSSLIFSKFNPLIKVCTCERWQSIIFQNFQI